MSPDKPAVPTSPSDAIAVIGMGCRLPGDIHSPGDLWRLVVDGREAVGPPPPERRKLLSRDGAAWTEGGVPSRGGFLRDVSGFDAQFFGVSGHEAAVLDPQHRLLLEVVWEALEHAGLSPDLLDGTATGIFTGMSYTDYMDRLAGHDSELEGSILTNGHCVAPGRISYLLGLRGPSVALDTACSSSLVALHLACQALRSDECAVAVASGVTLILQPRTSRSFARMGMLSATGRCHTFDAAADGFVRGEGCGAVVLKLLADAVRDGDRVLAVVRGSAVNQDGSSEGLAAPSADAQQAVYEDALGRAGVDPRDVAMIETHGTGTPVGDPTEFASLARVYGEGRDRCALTSVKTNLGHLEPAAGITGLIKAVSSLRHGFVPPNLHFSAWHPAIKPEGTRFFVPTGLERWPVRGGSRLAAVSSFGFSGTNAHVILEQAPTGTAARRAGARPGAGSRRPATPVVVLVPAGSPAALPTAAGRLADWLETDGADVPLRDVAHTLALRRGGGRGRLGVVAASRGRLVDALRSFAVGQPGPEVVTGSVGAAVSRRPVWVFSGQGSQWAGMGRGLLTAEPAFAATLAEVDPLIAAESGFSVLEALSSGEALEGCGRVQPVLFALQTALAATWRAHGVEPAGVIGHSMGEVAAAVVAGALSLADGVRVICRRSVLLDRTAGRGAMATVSLSAEIVASELRRADLTGSVAVAVIAAPDSTVVSGDAEQVRRLVTGWERRGVPTSLIAVDAASHSPLIDPVLPELETALADLTPGRPDVPFYTTVLDEPGHPPAFDAAYWCANLRRPVRFAAAVAAAAADRHLVYTEISPHPVVLHAVTRSLSGLVTDPAVLPTLHRDEDELATFRTQLAALHCAGGSVDWSVLYADAELADVPTITYDRKRHWVETALPGPPGSGPAAPPDRPPLPGVHTEVPGDQVRHSWQGDSGTAAVPWLADHEVHAAPVLPGAAHCALALTCACELFGAAAEEVEVTDIRFLELTRLTERTEITTTMTRTDPDTAKCQIHTRGPEGDWVRQAEASVRRLSRPARLEPVPSAGMSARHTRGVSPDAFYARLRQRGLTHGPAFTGITELRVSTDGSSLWARVELPAPARAAGLALRAHPVLLDLCAQLVAAGVTETEERVGDARSLILPVSMRSVRVLGDPATARHCHAQIRELTGDTLVGDARLLNEAGTPVLTVEGLRFARHTVPDTPDRAPDGWLLRIDWRRAPRPEPVSPQPAGGVVVIGAEDGSGGSMADAVRAAGGQAQLWAVDAAETRLESLTEQFGDRLGAVSPVRAVAVLCEHRPGDTAPSAGLRNARCLLAAARALAEFPAHPPRLYAITRGDRYVRTGDREDPSTSTLRGVVRVLAFEHPEMRATLLDADADDARFEGAAGELLADLPEDEVALRGESRYAAALAEAPLTDAEWAAAATRTVRYGADGFRLRIGTPGDLESLELTATGRRAPGPGEVEVRVAAAGLNFRDVLTASGLLPGEDDVRYRIGFECAGAVTRVGPGVRDFRPDDMVLAVDPGGGAFGSFVTVSVAGVARIPGKLDPVSAAGLPIAFLTAWYALRHVARVAPGERVLIHSATGGTGLAAIAVARRLGAEVLATAGNEEKRRLLRGMRISHVMDSRTLGFRELAREATGGEGVDVVLNSLAGPAIRAGLETLRPFGRFVELGVRDIMADTALGMAPLRHNVTFRPVDLIGLLRSRPGDVAEMLREVVEEIGAGRLKPPRCTPYPLEAATDAFRTMAGARHIGKLALTVPSRGRAKAVLPDGPVIVRKNGAYIVTGGLGGLGLAVAQWLASQGAGHLLLNGRTPPKPGAAQVLAKLAAGGTKVTVVLGDIADPVTAERLLSAAATRKWPLRGVVHCAMVLQDAAVTTVREDQLRRVWAPKVVGAWRLHEATAKQSLDWFVVFSSLASLVGNPGQAAYAAANAWLDGFAAWRSVRGLRTLSVNWGPWGETGVATDFADRGYATIPTARGLAVLRDLLAHRRVCTGVIPGEPETWIPASGRHSPFFRGILSGASRDKVPTTRESSGPGDIRTRLDSLPAGPARRTELETFLAGHIRRVLRLGGAVVDPQTPLKRLGFDSLLATEVRVRLEAELGIQLAGNFVWQHPTLGALAAGVAEKMGLDLG